MKDDDNRAVPLQAQPRGWKPMRQLITMSRSEQCGGVRPRRLGGLPPAWPPSSHATAPLPHRTNIFISFIAPSIKHSASLLSDPIGVSLHPPDWLVTFVILHPARSSFLAVAHPVTVRTERACAASVARGSDSLTRALALESPDTIMKFHSRALSLTSQDYSSVDLTGGPIAQVRVD
ncbi:hypothetical protein J6590_049993 [Homalodisca vitripennis]|nr:hypothetical protein J6590_049993 [Homalodisca vitripennis]